MTTTDAIDQLCQPLKCRESSYHVPFDRPLANYGFEIAFLDELNIEYGGVRNLAGRRPYGYQIHLEHEVAIIRCFAALF